MAASSPSAALLAGLLAEELGEIGAFIDLLKQEQELLATTGNVDELLSLVEKKTGFAARLAALSTRRERLLAEAGLEPGRAGMEALVAAGGATAQAAQWQKLLAQAAEARTLNDTNGKLIARRLQHNQQALEALLSATERAATYGPDGQQRGGGGGRFLGSA